MLNYIIYVDGILEKFLVAIALVFAIIIAIGFHEAAHGFIAYKCGDMTAKYEGRLTLNPMKHFDVFGILMFVIVGIGWAKPVPVNPSNFRNYRKGVFLVAIAGVVTNLILTFISAVLLTLVLFSVSMAGGVVEQTFAYYVVFFFEQFFLISIVLNISLIAFNLLPIFPLDGFRIVESFTRYDNPYCVFMRRYGIYVLLGLLIIGSFVPYLDIISMFLNLIRNGILKLISLVFGLSFV